MSLDALLGDADIPYALQQAPPQARAAGWATPAAFTPEVASPTNPDTRPSQLKIDVPLVEQAGFPPELGGWLAALHLQRPNRVELPAKLDGTYLAVRLSGERMLPTLPPHEILLCRYHPELRSAGLPGVFILGTRHNGAVIGRLVVAPANGKPLRLLADNPAYPRLNLPPADLLEVWQVVLRLTGAWAAPNPMEQRLQAVEHQLAALCDRFEHSGHDPAADQE